MVLGNQAECQGKAGVITVNSAFIIDNVRCYDTLRIIFSAGRANLPEKTSNINLSG
jgi:hypothetical protein